FGLFAHRTARLLLAALLVFATMLGLAALFMLVTAVLLGLVLVELNGTATLLIVPVLIHLRLLSLYDHFCQGKGARGKPPAQVGNCNFSSAQRAASATVGSVSPQARSSSGRAAGSPEFPRTMAAFRRSPDRLVRLKAVAPK